MRTSVQLGLGAMEVRPADRQRSTAVNRLDGASPTAVTDVDREREWLGLVGRAFGKSGLTHKAAAITMETDAGQLSAQLAGAPHKHLSFRKMVKLGPDFWLEMILLIVEFYELSLAGTERDRRDLETGRALRAVCQRAVQR